MERAHTDRPINLVTKESPVGAICLPLLEKSSESSEEGYRPIAMVGPASRNEWVFFHHVGILGISQYHLSRDQPELSRGLSKLKTGTITERKFILS